MGVPANVFERFVNAFTTSKVTKTIQKHGSYSPSVYGLIASVSFALSIGGATYAYRMYRDPWVQWDPDVRSSPLQEETNEKEYYRHPLHEALVENEKQHFEAAFPEIGKELRKDFGHS